MSNDSLSLEKELTKLERYFVKNGRHDLVAELRRSNREQLHERLKKQAVHLQEIADSKAKDDKLKAARNDVADLSAPYRESKTMCERISRLIHLIVQEQGG
jgi:hypothetical protein